MQLLRTSKELFFCENSQNKYCVLGLNIVYLILYKSYFGYYCIMFLLFG